MVENMAVSKTIEIHSLTKDMEKAGKSFYVMLCNLILYCNLLYYVKLCCVMTGYVMLCDVMLCHVMF